MTPSPHLGVWQQLALVIVIIVIDIVIIGIILDQPITKSHSSYFPLLAPQTVGRREDVPPVDESPTAHPDSEGLVQSLSVSDDRRQTKLLVA